MRLDIFLVVKCQQKKSTKHQFPKGNFYFPMLDYRK